MVVGLGGRGLRRHSCGSEGGVSDGRQELLQNLRRIHLYVFILYLAMYFAQLSKINHFDHHNHGKQKMQRIKIYRKVLFPGNDFRRRIINKATLLRDPGHAFFHSLSQLLWTPLQTNWCKLIVVSNTELVLSMFD